jgi:hypothetical protein
MFKKLQQQRSEEGFVLVAALMIMLVLTIIGIAMNRDTNTELQIAGNDKVYKQSFYDADGGTEFGAEVLEQNIACLRFSAGGVGSVAVDGNIILDNNIAVNSTSKQFWLNDVGHWTQINPLVPFPSDTARDMWYPPAYAAGQPHTNITVEGTVALGQDSSILFAAGYLGLGRSAAAGGTTLKYEVYSQHIGLNNSESTIRVEWNHIIGREDTFCRYD